MRRSVLFVGGACIAMVIAVSTLLAHAPSGAIFTTLSDGSEVNFNIYPSKEAVYLDGGPGPGAPQTAAGLDDGTYVFQVTDPSGHTLLSQDLPRCRRFTVANGVITGVVPAGGCEHATGTDVDHNAVTVQLMPYADTPNPGGEYKVWVTLEVDFACSLDVQDCGVSGPNKHGFIPRHTKTDNFKVNGDILEIDTRFFPDNNGNGVKDGDEDFIDGLGITWTDTLGASNVKWSYYDPSLFVFHEAHVEAVEEGRHKILIENQPGCTVTTVQTNGIQLGKKGPQEVSVQVPRDFTGERADTVWIDVACAR
jgi:hypothetical protein